MSLFSINSPNPPASLSRPHFAYPLKISQWLVGLLFGLVIGLIIASAGSTALFINFINPYRSALTTPETKYHNEKAEVDSQLRDAFGHMIEME